MLSAAQALVAPPPFDRTRGIGGTDAAAIMGLSPWRDALDVWREKSKDPSWSPRRASDAMKWGNLLEPVIRAAYSAKTGLGVLPGEPFDAEPQWHPDGIQYYHADGYVLTPDGTIEGLFEAKTASDPDQWTDGVPKHYQIQVQQGMAITGLPWCDVAVLIGGNDFRVYRITSDPELQARIRLEVEPFWAAVETGVWDFSPLPLEVALATADPGLPPVKADEDMLSAVLTLKEIRRQQEDLDASEAKVVEAIKTKIGNAPGADGDGWYIIWKNTKPTETTDWESVAVSLWNALESIRRDMAYGTDQQKPMPEKVAAMLDPKLYHVLMGLYTQTGKTSRPFLLKDGVRK